MKFTHGGSVSITCRVDAIRQTFIVDVQDTGIGLSEAGLSRLFQPFCQADSSITRRYGGTGLGLVISQRLIHRMHGNLEVFSEGEGMGCRFTATVPWMCPEASAELRAEVDLAPVRITLGEGWNPRVLVVDPLAARRQATCELLQVSVLPNAL